MQLLPFLYRRYIIINRRNSKMYKKERKQCKIVKEGVTTSIAYQDLPKKLQQKYRNSILFEADLNRIHKNKFEVDIEKLKQRKIDKQKTLEQKLDEYIVNPTEQKYLLRVFDNLKSLQEDSFGKKQILAVLKKLQMEMSNSDIDLMIWEFDQDLDKKISRKEFIAMYKKCMMDSAAAEPKKLFHLTQFLMYCQEDRHRISVEDTLELLYVRAQCQAQKNKCKVNNLFEESIKIIFGEDYQKDRNEVEKQITFGEYLQKINKKAIQKRRMEIEKLKAQLRY